MTSVPPPPYRHPGSPPVRPELPEGVEPAPGAWPSPPASAAPAGDDRAALPEFAPWTPFAALLVAYSLAIFAAFVIAAAAAAAGADIDTNDLPTGVVLGATLVQDALLVGFAILFARIGGARVSAAAFGLRPVRLGRGLGWALAAFGAFYVFTFVWSAVLQVTESDDLAQELGAADSAANLIAVTLLVTLAAPIAEELFFRGFLFGALWRWKGWIPAAIVSGIVFGVVHAGGTPVVFLVPLAVLGFLLCWLYRRTGSLLPGMGVHAFNNALALGVTLSWEWWQVLLAIVLAPVVVVAIASQVAARATPAPAAVGA
jgi:membrane protease YdiL (CAAX protease family)